jgi:hypothetical protein
MESLLSSCKLSHLAPCFAEQELTLPLLRSMASAPAHWEDSMEELGVPAAEASRLQQALLANAGTGSTGVENGAGSVSRASGLPPATPAFTQASISDLVASALSIVAATPAAAPVADAAEAEAAQKPYREGFSVTHINHVAPPQPKDSDALAAYKRRQLQQEVQQASSNQERGGPASKPQARYSPAPHAARTTRPLEKFSSGGVVSNACPPGGVVQVPPASARADVFGAPASCCPTAVDEAGLD